MIGIEREPINAQFAPKDRELIDKFERGLSSSQPYLFNLADQLVADFPARQWDALFVDDTNARLPARFLRKALEDYSGRTLPMYFIQSGKLARARVPREKYLQYMNFIADNLPSKDRSLIISESAGTLATANFLLELTRAKFSEVDFAVVALNSSKISPSANAYIGGYGKDVSRTVGETFEGAKEKSIFYFGRSLPGFVRRKTKRIFPEIVTDSTQKMTGVKASDSPYVAASRDINSAQLSSYFRERMDVLAREYFQRRKSL